MLATLILAKGLQNIDSEAEGLELRLKELRKSKKEITDLHQVMENATRNREEGQWCHYLNEVLDQDRVKKLEELSDKNPFVSAEDLEKIAKHEAEKCLIDLPKTLPEALDSVGLPVDGTSKFPKFTIRENYIKIEINERSFKASITPTNGKTIEVNADVPSIVKIVVAEDQRLFSKDFDSNTFVHCLVETFKGFKTSREKNLQGSLSWKELVKNWVGPKISADELGAQLGMTIRGSHHLLDDNGVLFNQEKGSENSLKPFGIDLLIGTLEIRFGEKRG